MIKERIKRARIIQQEITAMTEKCGGGGSLENKINIKDIKYITKGLKYM